MAIISVEQAKKDLKQHLLNKKNNSKEMLNLLLLIENVDDLIELEKIKLQYWKMII